MKNKILLIDDEKYLSWLWSIHLSRAGYEVHCANSAQEALTLCQQIKFHLVYLDLNLPDLDSKDLLKQIREVQPSEVKIIVISALNEDDNIDWLELGAVLKCEKPSQAEDIIKITQQILSGEK